ncbi:hypothetical protein PO909_008323 [Leuciscus waleckii]
MYGSTGLLCPSSYALVSHPFTCTTDFLAFCCASPFHLFSSVELHLTFSNALVLSSNGSASVLRHIGSTSAACYRSSAMASRTFCVARSHRLFCSAWVFTSISSISVCHSQGFVCQVATMAPPSLNSAMGLRPGFILGPNLAILAIVSFLASYF